MPYLPGKHQSFIEALSKLKPVDFDVCPHPDDLEAFLKDDATIISAFVEYYHARCNEAKAAGIDVSPAEAMGLLSDAFNDIAIGLHGDDRRRELVIERERFPHFRHAAE